MGVFDKFLWMIVKLLIVFNVLLVILVVVKFEISVVSNMAFYLSPTHTSIDSYNNDIKKVNFDIQTLSNYPCILECKYKFTDTSSKELIDSGEFTFSREIDASKKYFLQSPLLGTGQKIYHFDIECTNQRSFVCWFRNQNRSSSAVVILNYKLRAEEESLKKMLKNDLRGILSEVSIADMKNQEQEIIISDNEDFVNFNELSDEIEMSKLNFTELKNKSEYFRSLWSDEKYFTLENEINMFRQNSFYFDSVNGTLIDLKNLLLTHNSFISKLEKRKQNIKTFLNFFLMETASDRAKEEGNNLTDFMNKTFYQLLNKNFTSYSALNKKLSGSEIQYNRVRILAEQDIFSALNKGYGTLNESYDMLCKSKGYCIEPLKNEIFSDAKSNVAQIDKVCGKINDLGRISKLAHDNFTLTYYFKNHPADARIDAEQAYNNLSRELGLQIYINDENFTSYTRSVYNNKKNNIKNNYIRTQNEIFEKYNANISILNKKLITNYSGKINQSAYDYCRYLIQVFNSEADSLKNQMVFIELQDSCNNYLDTIEKNESANNSFSLPSLKNITIANQIPMEQLNATNSTFSHLSDDLLLLTMNYSYVTYEADYIRDYCSKISNSKADKEIDESIFKKSGFLEAQLKYSVIKTYNIITRINTIVQDNLPTCCVFGKCEVCCINENCRNESSLFPIILVHGHAFDKENNPMLSFDGLDSLENALQNDGYVKVDSIYPYPSYNNIKENELGMIRKPVIMKATYYVDYNDANFTNDELNLGIDAYTGRLNEIIEFVKFRTGKSKVNIIAHSMGGLVSRKYLETYGENSVNKLIMIATPNHGIAEGTKSLCLIAGRPTECIDMSNNSLYIWSVNNVQLKNQTKVYNIYGIGCDTEGIEGDGVVQMQSAYFEGIGNYAVKGNCTGLAKIFHNDILDAEMYPETYNIVKNILSKK